MLFRNGFCVHAVLTVRSRCPEWTAENGRGVCLRVAWPPRALYSKARKQRRGKM